MSSKTLHKKGASTPWYYQAVIKFIKPIYRFVLWRRHQKARKQGIPIADYQQECDARFGRHFPNPPVNPNTSSLVTSASLSDTLQTHLPDSHIADNQIALSNEVNKAVVPALNQTDVFLASSIWCHAVSLGETNTIAPMLNILLKRGAKVWLTNTTQTGFARGETLFAEAINAKQMVHTFVPVDDKKVVRKFVNHAKPDLVMFVETELWANTLEVLAHNNIPSVLVNARLSQKSFEGYQKFAAVSGSMMQNIAMIIAQDVASAKRFRQLGVAAHKIRRAASLKWSAGYPTSGDIKDKAIIGDKENIKNKAKNEASSTDNSNPTNLDSKLIAAFADNTSALQRPVWVAGSTHDKEEQLLIQVQQKLIQNPQLQDTLLILVPRHPERFDEVAKLLDASDLIVHRRSNKQLIARNTQVYLVDTMGELERCYQLADVAFVGGSLVNIGGHNPIEASRLAKPVVMGQYTHSCQELVDALSEVGALQVVSDDKNTQTVVDNLQSKVMHWLMHAEQARQAGQQGQALVMQKQSALCDQLAMIEGLLTQYLQEKQSKSDAYRLDVEAVEAYEAAHID